MKWSGFLPLAIVLATNCASAQDIVVRSGPPTAAIFDRNGFFLDPASCPVGLEVNRRPGLPVGMNAQGPAINRKLEPSVPSQRLQLIMTNLFSREITSANITAHGFSEKPRMMLLSNTPPDLAKAVNVVLNVKGLGRASSDVAFSHFAAITAIDVDSVTYADGSAWHASSPGACSVSPSLFMRVSESR